MHILYIYVYNSAGYSIRAEDLIHYIYILCVFYLCICRRPIPLLSGLLLLHALRRSLRSQGSGLRSLTPLLAASVIARR